jgi:hypothetical protein
MEILLAQPEVPYNPIEKCLRSSDFIYFQLSSDSK